MANNLAKIAVFWDQSFLWGLIAFDTLRRLRVDFKLLAAADVRLGRLQDFDIVFVPGGWASDKMEALGKDGARQIRSFVEAGGGYLGVCGGAGLALTHASGLGLAHLGRLPSTVRVPSFSGLIHLNLKEKTHPLWHGVPGGSAFYAWWPGQFALNENHPVRILASYGKPEAGASYVTDIPVTADADWNRWEKSYGINLNPARLKNEPAVIETGAGSGKVLLSYLHFETPADPRGHEVLLNALRYLSAGKQAARGATPSGPAPGGKLSGDPKPEQNPAAAIAAEIHQLISGLIEFGCLNFLWRWRTRPILQWRRGVRGIEYSTLFAMTDKISQLTAQFPDSSSAGLGRLQALREMTLSFTADARRLLMLERFAINNGPLSPLKSSDPAILPLREKLFSSSRRCGGLYKQIVDTANEILLPLLRRELKDG